MITMTAEQREQREETRAAEFEVINGCMKLPLMLPNGWDIP